jgi:Dickkopf N-terminal cysteine-rich region
MRTAIACGVFVVLVSCGNHGPDIDTTQDNVCDQIAEVACFDLYQCCSEGEIERTLMVSDPRTQAECQSDLTTRCKRVIADLDFSIKNKHEKFDAKVMNDCLKEFVAPENTCVTVETVKPWAMACMTSAWTGTVATGGTCDFIYECAPNNFCGTNRVCTALPTEAMPCSVQGCASGLFCDNAAAGGPVCRALLGTGIPCTSANQCQKGLFCDLGAPVGMRTCTPQLANGATCGTSLACTSTLCLTGTCSVTGFTCSTDAACEGRCSNNNVLCTADNQCGQGTCSIGGTPCTLPTDCTMPGSVCVLPGKCNLGKCTGNICADPHLTVDYCTNALSDLPVLGAPQIVVGGG